MTNIEYICVKLSANKITVIMLQFESNNYYYLLFAIYIMFVIILSVK